MLHSVDALTVLRVCGAWSTLRLLPLLKDGCITHELGKLTIFARFCAVDLDNRNFGRSSEVQISHRHWSVSRTCRTALEAQQALGAVRRTTV